MSQSLSTSDGLKLYQHHWPAKESSKARLLIVHGYGEHSHRYDRMAKRLVASGFEVHAYDHRGHGRSEGEAAYTPSFQHLVDDLHLIVENTKPDFILGHSMGGAVLATYVASHKPEVKGLIFSSPLFMVDDPPAKILQMIAAVTSKLMPKGYVPKFMYYLDPTLISSQPEETRAYAEDPHVYHGLLRNRTGHELNAMMLKRIKGDIACIKLPFLAVHGSADGITSPSSSQYLYDHAPAADKQLSFFDDCYHELFNDFKRDEVLDTVLDWLEDHI